MAGRMVCAVEIYGEHVDGSRINSFEVGFGD